MQVIPGKGLGFLTLGSSLHSVLSRLKSHPQTYPSIDVAYSPTRPLAEPVVLTLPPNGLRLRFDGPDQRLRLIEVLDFHKTPLVYKNNEVVKTSKSQDRQSASSGPTFRHVYNRLFGPSYPGEYIPPADGSPYGTYVLSYPGVAFSFPLQHSAWSEQCDFVALLSSSAASPATSMAIFQGTSWAEARTQLFTVAPQYPRSPSLIGKAKEGVPDEVEEIKIYGGGHIEVVRRSSPPFKITLSETTPQDLIAELGPPDAIYRRSDRRISIHGTPGAVRSHPMSPPPGQTLDTADTDQSSNNSVTDDSDDDMSPPNADPSSLPTECFFNYFHHGFDAFISYPTASGQPFPGSDIPDRPPPPPSNNLTVTKLILHGNVPGSYPFNRHRRSRWKIILNSSNDVITSESHYDDVSRRLKEVWRGSYANPADEEALNRGMVLNRGWGDSPESSVEFLGGWEESAGGRQRSVQPGQDGAHGLGNTELYGFPGLLFEVLKNGAISCLTIY